MRLNLEHIKRFHSLEIDPFVIYVTKISITYLLFRSGEKHGFKLKRQIKRKVALVELIQRKCKFQRAYVPF